MVIQRTINSLREKPKEDRKAIAGGIAIGVVVILFLSWATLFFRGIQRNSEQAAQESQQASAGEIFNDISQQIQVFGTEN